jgi:putative transposase
MNIVPNQIFHVYNRGNQRQTIFFEREHYLFFLRKVRQYISPHCSILAYCLMPNHFHLLLQSNEQTVAPSAALRREGIAPKIDMSNFAHGMKMLLSSYTKGINKQLGLSGSLFTQNTKAKQVSSEFSSEDYVLSCFYYIHQNPLKAGLVRDLSDWEYSSFPDYAGLRKGTLCDFSLAKEQLMLDWHEFKHEIMREIPTESLLKIW